MFVRLLWIYCVLCIGLVPAVQAQETVTSGVPWYTALDNIKARIQSLMEDNSRLTEEHRSLQEQEKKLWADIESQAQKNEQMRQLLKERKGKTDQQVRLEQLQAQALLKKTQIAAKQLDANAMQDRVDSLKRTIDLKRLKLSDWELHQNEAAAVAAVSPSVPEPLPVVDVSSGDIALDALRQELEGQKTQETILEKQLSRMTRAQAHPEIKILEDKLEALNKQRTELMQKVSAQGQGPSTFDRGRYAVTAQHKADLEAKIKVFEDKINSLKGSAAFDMSWPARKKKLVNQVVQADARNGKVRGQIASLREDIALLRDQVASLERKVNFANGRSK